MKKYLNDKLVEMTADEIAEFEQNKIKIQEQETEIANKLQAKEDLKASAKTKLMAGEPLTEEEADVMIGG